MLFLWLKMLISKLACKAVLSVMDKFERKINGQGALRAGKECTLFILYEDTDDKIRIAKSLKDSDLLINGKLKQ